MSDMERPDAEIVRDAIREAYLGHPRALRYVEKALDALDYWKFSGWSGWECRP